MLNSYPWYISDWRDSETRLRLSASERGLYRELIDYCYLEGSLPADREQIKLISGLDGHDFARAWKAVQFLFDTVSLPNGTRLEHRKVNEVRPRLLAYHEQKQHAGAKSGQARRERALNVRSGQNGIPSGTEVEPPPTPTTSTTTHENPQTPAPPAALVLDPPSPVRSDVAADASMPPGPGPQRKRRNGHRTTEEVRKALGERGAWFDATWEIGPWTDGKLPGMDAYELRVKEREMALEVHSGAKKYAAKIAADPTIKVKFLQGWINDERWKDENRIPMARAPSKTDAVKALVQANLERTGRPFG